jgi:hypothetical protein
MAPRTPRGGKNEFSAQVRTNYHKDYSGISRKSKNSAISGSEIPIDDNCIDLPNGSGTAYMSGHWL